MEWNGMEVCPLNITYSLYHSLLARGIPYGSTRLIISELDKSGRQLSVL